MKQLSLAHSGFEVQRKVTRKRQFLNEMNIVVPWAELVALIEPHYPKNSTGRRAYPLAVMLRIHFLQQWFNLSDPAMEEAMHDVPLYREFVGLDMGQSKVPDESTILLFRHLLERHQLADLMLATVNTILTDKGLMLKAGTAVDATLIAAPSSTKNSTGERDPQMHQTKKGNNYHFGMKAHIGVDADSGLVHTVIGTAANVHDVTQAKDLLHGQEEIALGDAGYQGVDKREEHKDSKVTWFTAMRPGKRKQMRRSASLIDQLTEGFEKTKASARAKVEHPFRVLKRQFGYVLVRYKGLAKNTAQIKTLFALSNLWMARKDLMRMTG